MNIRLYCNDLMTRVRLESRFRSAGATILKPQEDAAPDLLLIDLTLATAASDIATLRSQHPDCRIIAFGPHVDGDAFKAAKQAGADELVARGKVMERVLARIKSED